MASHKLKKLQIVRRIEREDAEPAFGGKLEERNPKFETRGAYTNNFAEQSQKPAFGGKSEIRSSKSETSGPYGENFAEQSQFAPDLMGSTSFMERDYDDTTHPETAGNKANSPPSAGNSKHEIRNSKRAELTQKISQNKANGPPGGGKSEVLSSKPVPFDKLRAGSEPVRLRSG